jgi:hypothetical protein
MGSSASQGLACARRHAREVHQPQQRGRQADASARCCHHQLVQAAEPGPCGSSLSARLQAALQACEAQQGRQLRRVHALAAWQAQGGQRCHRRRPLWRPRAWRRLLAHLAGEAQLLSRLLCLLASFVAAFASATSAAAAAGTPPAAATTTATTTATTNSHCLQHQIALLGAAQQRRPLQRRAQQRPAEPRRPLQRRPLQRPAQQRPAQPRRPLQRPAQQRRPLQLRPDGAGGHSSA